MHAIAFLPELLLGNEPSFTTTNITSVASSI
jgi:hypothetical protein